MLSDSFNIKQKQRHGCLTTWLLVIIAFNIISLIITLPKGSPSVQDLPWGQALIGIAFCLFNIVCAIGLFMWKKWAFWGLCISLAAQFVASIILGNLVIFALIGIAIQFTLLMFALKAGTDNKGWDQLE